MASWRVVSHKFSPGQRLYYEWNAESRCQQYSWPCNWRWVEKVVVVRGHRPPQKPTSVPITISTAAGRVCDVIRGQLAPSRRHSERLRVWERERDLDVRKGEVSGFDFATDYAMMLSFFFCPCLNWVIKKIEPFLKILMTVSSSIKIYKIIPDLFNTRNLAFPIEKYNTVKII